MVQINFQPRFAMLIRTGRKRQTIRLPRTRDPRPGDLLQLYVGLRTPRAQRIKRPDPLCLGCHPLEMLIRPKGDKRARSAFRFTDTLPPWMGEEAADWTDLDEPFADRDGHSGVEAMETFFRDHPALKNARAGGEPLLFKGNLIHW